MSISLSNFSSFKPRVSFGAIQQLFLADRESAPKPVCDAKTAKVLLEAFGRAEEASSHLYDEAFGYDFTANGKNRTEPRLFKMPAGDYVILSGPDAALTDIAITKKLTTVKPAELIYTVG